MLPSAEQCPQNKEGKIGIPRENSSSLSCFFERSVKEMLTPDELHLFTTNPTQALVLAKSGDNNAFAYLVSLHIKDFYSKAVRLSENKEDAQDLVQDTLIKLKNSIQELSSVSELKAWGLKILINLQLDFYREQGAQKRGGGVDLVDIDRAPEVVGTDGFSEVRFRELLHHYFGNNDQAMKVILLKYKYGFSMEEISKILNISVSTLKRHRSDTLEKRQGRTSNNL